MNSWIVWAVFVWVALVLGLVGYHFSLRMLRIVAGFFALATAIYITWYGLTYPAQPPPGSLSGAFTQGADSIGMALFRQPPPHPVVGPGPVGWLVIIVLLVIGYRELEAWTLHCQARCLDMSALTGSRSGNQQDDTPGGGGDALGKQRHDRLLAELRFRLPAVEVRAPSILPGGSRSSGLASIVEASGVSGSGLAGAVIRFFGVLWPGQRRVQVRVWVEGLPGQAKITDVTTVTVSLQDPQSGASLATKTLAARDIDEAASVVAGFVARQIFAEDPTAPPWCTGAADGRDLAALLRARQVRPYPESEHEVRCARQQQIQILERVADSNLCAGITRYELAQLYDLEGRHVEALLMHAINRERYPRFYRGRYRLAMSLEMISNPDPGKTIDAAKVPKLDEALRILYRTGVIKTAKNSVALHGGAVELPPELRAELLDAAWEELQAIRRYLTLPHVIWRSFWHRDERGILKQYLRLQHRQSFHDGVRVALLLVAVRLAMNDTGGRALERSPEADVPPGPARKLPHARTTIRIATAIAGDIADIVQVLRLGPDQTAGRRPPQLTKSLRTRRQPWQCSTRSWQAAYNLACAYAAIAHNCQREPQAAANTRNIKADPDKLVRLAVTSLEFAVGVPECELEHPCEWIAVDPDFGSLRFSDDEVSKAFRDYLTAQQQRDYPDGCQDGGQDQAGPGHDEAGSGRTARPSPPSAVHR
jgi:hypothetical protein